YTPHWFSQDTLTYNSGANQYTFGDTQSDKIVMYGFGGSLPTNEQGTFQSYTDPYGHVTQVTSRATDGRIAEVQRTLTQSPSGGTNGPQGPGNTTYIESYLNTFITSGPNINRVPNVTLRRKSDLTSWSTVRQTVYTYYSGEAYGNTGDLKLFQVEDGSGNIIDTSYFRYYTGESGGYVHGL